MGSCYSTTGVDDDNSADITTLPPNQRTQSGTQDNYAERVQRLFDTTLQNGNTNTLTNNRRSMSGNNNSSADTTASTRHRSRSGDHRKGSTSSPPRHRSEFHKHR